MKLLAAITAYVTLRQALGADFTTAAKILRSFVRAIGDVPVESINTARCASFCIGRDPRSGFRTAKHTTLRVFFRYLVGRGHVAASPLAEPAPRPSLIFTPYIYSIDELRRLLEQADAACSKRAWLEPDTLRTILLLLYGTGLRIGEALRLRVQDVDLEERVLSISNAKFFKSRLVPIGDKLRSALSRYRASRPRRALQAEIPFFTFRTGRALSYAAVRAAFSRVRERAGIRRPSTDRSQPRLHDLRATFAVHRLVAWYREGADVQVRLPFLSTYLGHASVAGTQVYLRMTPALLSEASLRFERYASLRGDGTRG